MFVLNCKESCRLHQAAVLYDWFLASLNFYVDDVATYNCYLLSLTTPNSRQSYAVKLGQEPAYEVKRLVAALATKDKRSDTKGHATTVCITFILTAGQRLQSASHRAAAFERLVADEIIMQQLNS